MSTFIILRGKKKAWENMSQLLATGNLDVINLLCVRLPVMQGLDILTYKTITLAGEFNVSVCSCLLS